MSKHGHQANSARFCSAVFAFMVRDFDSSKNCLIVEPVFIVEPVLNNTSKYESDITRVSDTIAKYLKESSAKCKSD